MRLLQSQEALGQSFSHLNVHQNHLGGLVGLHTEIHRLQVGGEASI